MKGCSYRKDGECPSFRISVVDAVFDIGKLSFTEQAPVAVMMQITYIQTTGNSKTEGCRVRQKSKWSTRGGEFIQIVVWKGKYTGYLNFVK